MAAVPGAPGGAHLGVLAASAAVPGVAPAADGVVAPAIPWSRLLSFYSFSKVPVHNQSRQFEDADVLGFSFLFFQSIHFYSYPIPRIQKQILQK